MPPPYVTRLRWTQVRFLNEAMERFGNQETVPVYYCLFTLSTVAGSNMLYRDFEGECSYASPNPNRTHHALSRL